MKASSVLLVKKQFSWSKLECKGIIGKKTQDHTAYLWPLQHIARPKINIK
jgi:hypothetical protein